MSKRYPGNFITGNPVALSQTSNNGIWDLKDNYTATGNNTWQESDGIYEIGGSLRVRRTANSYLTRTPLVAGNRKTYTVSCWFKRSLWYDQAGEGFSVLDCGRPNNPWTGMGYGSGDGVANADTLFFSVTGGQSPSAFVSQINRDSSAWAHVVYQVDTTQLVPQNRVRIYLNGVQQTWSYYNNWPSQNSDTYVNSTTSHAIGCLSNDSPGNNQLDGNLCEYYIIDGLALDATYFGYYDPITQIWQPKKYTGGYGTNGCYLPLQPVTPVNYNIPGSGLPAYNFTNLPVSALMNTSNSLSLANQTAFNPGTSDFCIEGWFYFSSIGGTSTNLFGFNNGSGSNPKMSGYINSGGDLHFDFTLAGGASQYSTASGIMKTGRWYHLAFVRSSNVLTVYINGTAWPNANNSSSTTTSLTTNLTGITAPFYLGYVGESYGSKLDGYVTNFRYVKGSPVYTSNFIPSPTGLTSITNTQFLIAQTSSLTTDYGPSGYTVTNNASVSASTGARIANLNIGLDLSGNGNWWYPINFVTYSNDNSFDISVDSPTNVFTTATDTGGVVPGNYNVINPMSNVNNTISYGGLSVSTGGNYSAFYSSIAVNRGKWYFEITKQSSGDMAFGLFQKTMNPNNENQMGNGTDNVGFYLYYNQGNGLGDTSASNNRLQYNSSHYGAPVGFGNDDTGTVYGCTLDFDTSVVTVYRNNDNTNRLYWTMPAALTANPLMVGYCVRTTWPATTMDFNFGQRPFVYTPPTGYKSLNTTNIQALGNLSAAAIQPHKFFDTLIYAGTSGANYLNNRGSFQPDITAMKCKMSAEGWHWMDSGRGNNRFLLSSPNGPSSVAGTTPEFQGSQNSGYNKAYFSTTGIQLDGNGSNDEINLKGRNYLNVQWKASSSSGIAVVTYTGTGSARTISHNLGAAPSMMIIKCRDTSYNWAVYHSGLTSAAYALQLNSSGDQTNSYDYWNSTAPTSSVFSLGTDNGVNQSGKTYVAYLFAEAQGFSKFGAYVGNNSNNGPFINCGFKPRLIGFKTLNYGGATDWPFVNASSAPGNPAGYRNWWSINNVEFSTSVGDINSNGFKFRDNDPVYNGSYNYIYYAFAESPFALNNRMR